MSWIDLVLVLIVATLTSLGAERRLAGFLVGLGGAILLRPLLLLADRNVVVGVLAALVAGLCLSLVGRRLYRQNRGGNALLTGLGGLGGLLLGVCLVITLVTSFPIQRNPANPSELFYPPRDLAPPIAKAVRDSRLVEVGRDILLYPLLVRQGDIGPVEQRVVQGLHRLFVVGQPWTVEF